jgi:tripartite-type tricarboxylate transporter receptor subunit TctC
MATLIVAPNGWAQTYPSGPVQIIVPYAKDGSADIFARTIAGELARKLNQAVTVENRPGAGGAVGLQSMTRAAPDGRTLLLGQTGEIVVQPFFLKQPGPRPTPVALVATIPLAVVVSATAPYATLRDLIETARTAPRGLSVASPGRLTPGDLAIELFRNKTSGKLASVPFDGGGPALNAVSDGVVDLYFSTLTSAMPYLRSGKVKILAVTSAERSPAVPDVPTVQENGVRRFSVVQWAGIFVPRDTPGDIITRLNRDINQTLAQPEIASKIMQDGGKITPLSQGQFADFIRTDGKVYEDLLTSELCAEFIVESCSGGGVFAQ